MDQRPFHTIITTFSNIIGFAVLRGFHTHTVCRPQLLVYFWFRARRSRLEASPSATANCRLSSGPLAIINTRLSRLISLDMEELGKNPTTGRMWFQFKVPFRIGGIFWFCPTFPHRSLGPPGGGQGPTVCAEKDKVISMHYEVKRWLVFRVIKKLRDKKL